MSQISLENGHRRRKRGILRICKFHWGRLGGEKRAPQKPGDWSNDNRRPTGEPTHELVRQILDGRLLPGLRLSSKMPRSHFFKELTKPDMTQGISTIHQTSAEPLSYKQSSHPTSHLRLCFPPRTPHLIGNFLAYFRISSGSSDNMNGLSPCIQGP